MSNIIYHMVDFEIIFNTVHVPTSHELHGIVIVLLFFFPPNQRDNNKNVKKWFLMSTS